jgi:hypothetical protein
MTARELKYPSGEDIRSGDRVEYGEHPGEVELVADPRTPTDETEWYIKEFGGGIMIAEPKVFGHVFLDDPQTDDHLAFIGRKHNE